MSRLKLQHGVSRIRRAKLQSSVDQTTVDDIDLMASWSNNETQYVINELLRFAIAQEEDFLKYKASLSATPSRSITETKPVPSTIKPASETAAKPDTPVSGNQRTDDSLNARGWFLSLSRQPRCIPIVATQSVASLKDALPNEGVKTLLQAFRTKVFLTTSDPETARYASELCGKEDRTRIGYTLSETSTNANVGWLSGRTSASKGSVAAVKQYQKQKEPVFEEKAFFDLKNAQSIVVAFDGVSPQPPTYCYLKPDFLPITMNWFEQEMIDFDPRRI